MLFWQHVCAGICVAGHEETGKGGGAFGHLCRLEKVLDYLQIDTVCVGYLCPRTCLVSLFVGFCLSSIAGKVTSKLNNANAAWKCLISLVLLNRSLTLPASPQKSTF